MLVFRRSKLYYTASGIITLKQVSCLKLLKHNTSETPNRKQQCLCYAAWWPSMLNILQDFNCPRNLYNLTKSYLSQRIAVMTTNTIQVAREVSKGCPHGSCCGPGLRNIQYNSLPNLEFRKKNQSNSHCRRFTNSREGTKRTGGRKHYKFGDGLGL